MKAMGNTSWYQWVGTTLMVGAIGSLAPMAKAEQIQAPDARSVQPAQVASAPQASTAQTSTTQASVPQQVEIAQYDETYVLTDVEPLPTIPDAFQRAFYSHNGNFYDNRGIRESLRLIFGIPHYVENAIYLDGRSVNRLYREVLQQQVASDPVLRTPDLPNPYTGSILTTPLVITEEATEAVPLFPPMRRPPIAPAPAGNAGSTTAPAPRDSTTPVPALW
jgi:hypothetical protein